MPIHRSRWVILTVGRFWKSFSEHGFVKIRILIFSIDCSSIYIGRWIDILYKGHFKNDCSVDMHQIFHCYVSLTLSISLFSSKVPFLTLTGSLFFLYLVDFDCSINFSDEPIASKESNSSSKKKNINRHNECITKINNCGGETFKRQLCSVIMTGINEEVYRCETGCQKTKIGRWKFEKYIYGFYLRHHHR